MFYAGMMPLLWPPLAPRLTAHGGNAAYFAYSRARKRLSLQANEPVPVPHRWGEFNDALFSVKPTWLVRAAA